MSTEHTGRGDPARTIALLWGTRERGARGPRPGLTVEQIVAAAIAVADATGLAGLSMRRVAERLGVGTMSLYRYVPSKAELLDVMVDRVAGETARPEHMPGDWRASLEQIARENYLLYQRHPWLLQIYSGRPPLGPNIIAKYDYELGAVADIGLSDVEMDSVLTMVHEFVRGSAATAAEWRRMPAHTGQSDDAWWLALSPLLSAAFDPALYPLASRVGAAATDHYRGTYDPGHAFAFGLDRLLDGIAVLVAARSRP
jgi:AcrR family transcriptional regulator